MTIAISITHPKRFFGLVRRVSQTLRVKRSFLYRFVRFSRPAVAYAYSVHSCTFSAAKGTDYKYFITFARIRWPGVHAMISTMLSTMTQRPSDDIIHNQHIYPLGYCGKAWLISEQSFYPQHFWKQNAEGRRVVV